MVVGTALPPGWFALAAALPVSPHLLPQCQAASGQMMCLPLPAGSSARGAAHVLPWHGRRRLRACVVVVAATDAVGQLPRRDRRLGLGLQVMLLLLLLLLLVVMLVVVVVMLLLLVMLVLVVMLLRRRHGGMVRGALLRRCALLLPDARNRRKGGGRLVGPRAAHVMSAGQAVGGQRWCRQP